MENTNNGIHLTGKEGEEFDLQLAASWTKNHREKHPGQPVSHFFGKEILQKILGQEGCQGIRFYPLNEDGQKHLIMVGATSDGNDQLNTVAAKAPQTGAKAGLQAHILGRPGRRVVRKMY